MLAHLRDCTAGCFAVIFFTFRFLYALQNDFNNNRVYELGHRYVLGPFQSHINPRFAGRVKMALSRTQKILCPRT